MAKGVKRQQGFTAAEEQLLAVSRDSFRNSTLKWNSPTLLFYSGLQPNYLGQRHSRFLDSCSLRCRYSNLDSDSNSPVLGKFIFLLDFWNFSNFEWLFRLPTTWSTLSLVPCCKQLLCNLPTRTSSSCQGYVFSTTFQELTFFAGKNCHFEIRSNCRRSEQPGRKTDQPTGVGRSYPPPQGNISAKIRQLSSFVISRFFQLLPIKISWKQSDIQWLIKKTDWFIFALSARIT